uniref:Novel type two secreted protein A n=1 Tax=Legionella pneumophila subsp. pneumophila TaxID=91891 RepID=A0A0U5KQ78_LEGPN|nr:novel type two secreted protein A [Legionella pneumophila subsp. pneumophila]
MSRKLLIATTLVLSTSLFPLISNAEDTANPNEMTKDAWLNSMTPLLPDLICRGFIQDPDLKKRFDEIKMTYEQCVTLIPESTKKYQDELYASMPDKINSETAGTWGRSLGECIGKDFAEKHLIPK